MKKAGKLLSVGYEGLTIAEFCSLVSKAKVDVICDVRKNAISRKKGFSKNKLKEALAGVDIGYVHLPSLGIPSEKRKLARTERAWEKMLSEYEMALSSPDWDPIMHLVAEGQRVALLCFEKDPETCHRTRLAHRIEQENPKLLVNEITRDKTD